MPASRRTAAAAAMTSKRGGAGAVQHRRARDGVAAVVVEHVEDLHRGAVGECPVPVVQRPALVGSFRGAASPGVLRRLRRLRRRSARGPCRIRQIVDSDGKPGRSRRWNAIVAGAAVQSGVVELLALGDDGVLDVDRQCDRPDDAAPATSAQRRLTLGARNVDAGPRRTSVLTPCRPTELGHVQLTEISLDDRSSQAHGHFLSRHEPPGSSRTLTERDAPRHV